MKVKNKDCPTGYILNSKGECVHALSTKGSKIAVGSLLTAFTGVGAKAISDKVKAKKAAKKTAKVVLEDKTKMKVGGKKKTISKYKK